MLITLNTLSIFLVWLKRTISTLWNIKCCVLRECIKHGYGAQDTYRFSTTCVHKHIDFTLLWYIDVRKKTDRHTYLFLFYECVRRQKVFCLLKVLKTEEEKIISFYRYNELCNDHQKTYGRYKTLFLQWKNARNSSVDVLRCDF